MPGRPILRDAFARGMVSGAALVGALGGSLVLNLGAVVLFALGMAVGAAIAAFACSRWPGLSAPAWRLWPAAVAFNPMVLLGAGYLDRQLGVPGGHEDGLELPVHGARPDAVRARSRAADHWPDRALVDGPAA